MKYVIIIFLVTFWLFVPYGFTLLDMGNYNSITPSDDILTILKDIFLLSIPNLYTPLKIMLWVFRVLSVIALYFAIRGD